jgi:uncharacterized membrane protein YdbT with pleckstrin-like domain
MVAFLKIFLAALCFVIAVMLMLTVLASLLNKKAETFFDEGEMLWIDRRHVWGFPISFTKYSMNNERLFVRSGLLNLVENEVRLYRVLDLQLVQSLKQRLLGLGTIVVRTSDKSLHTFELRNICHAREVKELLSEHVEEQRQKNRVSSREYMAVDTDEEDDNADDFV